MTLTCNIHSLLWRLTFLKWFRFILLSHTVTPSSSSSWTVSLWASKNKTCQNHQISASVCFTSGRTEKDKPSGDKPLQPQQPSSSAQKHVFINSRVDDDESQRSEKSRISRQNSFKNRPNSDVLISNLGITANFIYKGSSFIRNVKSRVLNTFMRRDCVKNRFNFHTWWVNLIYTYLVAFDGVFLLQLALSQSLIFLLKLLQLFGRDLKTTAKLIKSSFYCWLRLLGLIKISAHPSRLWAGGGRGGRGNRELDKTVSGSQLLHHLPESVGTISYFSLHQRCFHAFVPRQD